MEEIQHPRLMEFFVENIRSDSPSPNLLFIDVKSIMYILSINQQFSLLQLNNGQKFAIYGNAKVQNTRWTYGLTRALKSKHVDYFADRIIRPSLYFNFDNLKFEVENIHLDEYLTLGVLYYFLKDNMLATLANNEEAVKYSFGTMSYLEEINTKLLDSKSQLKENLNNVLTLAI